MKRADSLDRSLDSSYWTRDGRKIRLFYHVDCFSGQSDPRSQPGSSYYGELGAVVSEKAPSTKGFGKV
ncbi:MAG: hypothetical protein EZS28_040928 [Streblomastix strix]|uniref:Uncharacterized protein n=1 Tax=Streblomastix strix TaxID=222440 RepID=A0A5J4U1M7_9EUKA|nr:MAG: hypothetical protein EZS28_040928 [Streblomastix strix]